MKLLTYKECGLDTKTQKNFNDISYNVSHFNWDFLLINSGLERSGKSALSFDQAYYLWKTGLKFDWSPDLKNVYFFEPNLAKKMLNLEKQSVAIIDEGGENLLSRKAMEKEVIEIIQTLMVYGAKNIVLIINMPDWRWLDKYVRESRVRALFEVWSYPKWIKDSEGNTICSRERGFYRAYSRKKVLEASRKEPPRLGKPSFYGRFKSFESVYPEAWKWYEVKKTNFLMEKMNRGRKTESEVKRGLPSSKIDLLEKLKSLERKPS